MGTSRLFAGNLATLVFTVLAFLQLLPWPVAGYLIIGSVLLVSLTQFNSTRVQQSISQEPTASRPIVTVQERPAQTPAKRLEEKALDKKTEPKESKPRRAAAKKAPSDETPVEETSSEEKPGDAPARIAEGDYLSFRVDLGKGEEVVGEISSNGDINVYVLNEDNLTALDLDQEFWYEAGSEGVRNSTLHFTAPDDGEWFLVVENADTKEVNATVKVSVNSASHSIPLLKTEGLGLPDAKLEGKLGA